MASSGLKNWIKEYFTKPPLLHSAFYLSSGYLSGIHVSSKDRKIKHHFITPLEKGVIQPSFNKKNIENGSLLEEKLKEGVEKLHLNDQKISCLVPELSMKAFVFSFDSLPPSMQEKGQIIRFRVKKQMAFLPEDARFSFEVIKSNHSEKVIVSLARASVIQEYEDFFRQLGLKVRVVNSPLFSLYNVVNKEKNGEFLLGNIEGDSLGLLAIIDSEIVLYRQKQIGLESEVDSPSGQQIENITREIENTANFVEDKEKRKITSLLVRLGLVGEKEETFSQLKRKLSFPVERIDVSYASDLTLEERQFLSPLIGQIA